MSDGWLAGIVRGTAPGAPVVFVHGFGGNRHFFDAQLAHVEDHAKVIAYDQRGCGGSSPAPRKRYDLDTLVTDQTASRDATAAPCRSVVRLHGVSHWPMLDAPDAVSQAIDAALPGGH